MIPQLGRLVLIGLLIGASAGGGADDSAALTEIGPLVTLGTDAGAQVGLTSGLFVIGDHVYIGERDGWVRLIDPTGTVTTVTGNGRHETTGDGGPAAGAGLESLGGIASEGLYVYLADPAAHRVRMITPLGDITTAAGTGEEGVSGDGGYATNARLRRPTDVEVTPDGALLYIADADANQVRMVRVLVGLGEGETFGADGTITTVAGTGEEGSGGDGGPATEARLASPFRVAVGPDGELYILESPEGPARVRRVDPDGTISTVVGGGACGEDAAREQPSLCGGASDIAVDTTGALYVHDRATDAVWLVGPDGDRARLPIYLSHLFSLTVDTDGDLYVGRRTDATPGTYVVQRVPLSEPIAPVVGAVAGWEGRGAGMVAQVAGTGELGYSGDGGPATEARLAEPGRLAVGSDGTVYVADRLNSRVRSIGVDGIIETIAGTGEQSPPPGTTPGPAPGDGHAATEVPLRPSIAGLAAGPDGSVYICDGTSHRVYRVNPLGAITTFAGTGEPAYAGDGTLAIDAALAEPVDVAVGPDGSGYIADHGNNRIRKVDPGGTITTVAEIDRPVAVEVAPNGVVYAVASGRIWRIGPSGAPAPLDLAVISPTDIAVGPDGLLYASTGAEVFSIHEDGTTELVGGTEAEAGRPVVDGIAFDAAGNLYLSHMVANQVTVVVRATDQPDGFPWHWLVLAVVAVVAVAAVALSLRPARRGVARA